MMVVVVFNSSVILPAPSFVPVVVSTATCRLLLHITWVRLMTMTPPIIESNVFCEAVADIFVLLITARTPLVLTLTRLVILGAVAALVHSIGVAAAAVSAARPTVAVVFVGAVGGRRVGAARTAPTLLVG